MNFVQSIILALVEGITEFLPISSTGHMILVAKLINLSQSEFVKSFEIVIQLGAILAVVVLYFKKLTGEKSRVLYPKILAAFVPTGVLGLVLYKIVKTYLIGNAMVTLLSLFLGGIVLIWFERTVKDKEGKIGDLTVKKAAGIGLFQAISMIPGVSRAAATIIGARIMGLSRKEAVEFSFLLAIPTMVAATGLDLIKAGFSYSFQEYELLFVGLLGAFLTAIVVVKWLIKYVQGHNLESFGWYRIVLALVFWIMVK